MITIDVKDNHSTVHTFTSGAGEEYVLVNGNFVTVNGNLTTVVDE